jgi:glycosyltransferase involved in cell wall biosynthesis
MRILHLSDALHPPVTGGTEVFIDRLLAAQARLPQPVQALWAAHADPGSDPPAADPGADRLLLPPVQPADRCRRLAMEAGGLPGFAALLDGFRPQVLHLHSWSDRCGLSHVLAARARGIRVVMTVHAPGFTCLQGSLRFRRRQVCDGRIDDRRCTDCRLVNGGVPAPLAVLVACQNGWPLGPDSPGRLAHLLTARPLTAAFRRGWQRLLPEVAAFHVLARWSAEVLHRNGVPMERVHLVRSAGPVPLPQRPRPPRGAAPLRLVWWGRCAEVKGVHLLVEAIRRLPAELPLQLDLWGPGWDSPYGRRLQRRLDGDPRIRHRGCLPPADLLPRLAGYDLGLLPSLWPETGPLTLLEAFAAGLPVAGSDRGGLAELIGDHGGGVLLPPTQQAWRAFLAAIARGERPLPAPAGVVGRTVDTLALELQPLYAP